MTIRQGSYKFLSKLEVACAIVGIGFFYFFFLNK